MTTEEIEDCLKNNYTLYKKYSNSLNNRVDSPDDILQETMLFCLENSKKLADKLQDCIELNKYIYTIIQYSNYRKDGRTNLSSYQSKYNKMKTTEIGNGLKQLPNENCFQEFEEHYKLLDELIEKYDTTKVIDEMIHSNNPSEIKKNNSKIYNKVVQNIKKHIKNEEK
jgi:hypothetical protein